MALGLHNIYPALGSKKKKKIIGRGNSSGHGTYSTRGLKGQKARSGGSGGLNLMGMRSVILSAPKKKGFFRRGVSWVEVNLNKIEANFSDGAIITPELLLKNKIVATIKPGIKILAVGKLTKKVNIRAHAFSASAKKIIEQAGGTVGVIKKNKK